MDLVNIKINGMSYSVPQGSTILEAARYAGIHIPTLCFLKDLNEIGACRMCVVEVKGARSLVASCVYPVNEGMEIFTNTKKVQQSRKTTLELILSNHNRKCLSCSRSGKCELQTLCAELGVEDDGRFDGSKTETVKDESSLHLVRDNSKCVLCRRCVAACELALSARTTVASIHRSAVLSTKSLPTYRAYHAVSVSLRAPQAHCTRETTQPTLLTL